jgi:atypical dual specificity phosphatase
LTFRNFSYVLENRLAGMAAPGWSPDRLADTLTFLSKQGIGGIVSLTEEALDAPTIEAANFRYLHLPVADFTPPDLEQVDAFVTFVDAAQEADAVGTVAHCAAGIGRTGTMLACYLVREGVPAPEAIARIRSLRPGSIETAEQEALVARYERTRADRDASA